MTKTKYITLSIALMIFASIAMSFISSNSKTEKYDYLVTISTDFGDMKLMLFDDTPIHKANFIKLAQEEKFDSSIFHRVINNFMIQGGALTPADQQAWDTLSFEDKTLPNEIMEKHKNIYGALAAARIENPTKRSDNSQFYIVQNHSGAHYLDNNYTVFGQLLVGYDVLDKIVSQKLNGSSPVEPIKMKVSVAKVKRTDMIKFYGDIYAKYAGGV